MSDASIELFVRLLVSLITSAFFGVFAGIYLAKKSAEVIREVKQTHFRELAHATRMLHHANRAAVTRRAVSLLCSEGIIRQAFYPRCTMNIHQITYLQNDAKECGNALQQVARILRHGEDNDDIKAAIALVFEALQHNAAIRQKLGDYAFEANEAQFVSAGNV